MDLPQSDLTTLEGIRVTTTERTIADLAAMLPMTALESALDDAIRRRLIKLQTLRGRRLVGPGSRNLRIALAQRVDRDPVPGSVLERNFLGALRRSGLPEPRRQWPVRRGGRVIAIVDFAYPEQRVVIEVDGYRYHTGRRDWQRDLARQNEIVACGYDVLRFTSQDVAEHPDETCARVAILLARRNS
jgi:very-short-patch-repair endonuclease